MAVRSTARNSACAPFEAEKAAPRTPGRSRRGPVLAAYAVAARSQGRCGCHAAAGLLPLENASQQGPMREVLASKPAGLSFCRAGPAARHEGLRPVGASGGEQPPGRRELGAHRVQCARAPG